MAVNVLRFGNPRAAPARRRSWFCSPPGGLHGRANDEEGSSPSEIVCGAWLFGQIPLDLVDEGKWNPTTAPLNSGTASHRRASWIWQVSTVASKAVRTVCSALVFHVRLCFFSCLLHLLGIKTNVAHLAVSAQAKALSAYICRCCSTRESCVQLWSPQHRTKLELLERGQRRPQQ